MAAQRATSTTKIRQRAATLLALTLAASACGASPEEELTRALEPAIAQTSFADETVASCASAALITNIGIDDLADKEVTPESLSLDPSMLDAFFGEAPDEVLQTVATCVDERQLFAEVFASEVQASEALDCASKNVTDNRAMDVTFGLIRGEDVEVDAEYDGSVALECLAEEAAARFLGLPAAASVADGYSSTLQSDHDVTSPEATCAAEALENFGPLRLDELGLTADSFNDGMNLRRIEFGDGELELLVQGWVDCSAMNERIAEHVFDSWPDLQDCLVDSIDEEQESQWSKAWLEGGRARLSRALSHLHPMMSECTLERDTALFGTLDDKEKDNVAFFLGRDYLAFEATEPLRNSLEIHEQICVGRGLLAHIEVDALARIDEIFMSYEDDDEAFARASQDPFYFSFVAAFFNARSACLHVETLLQDDLSWFEFSEKTLRCVLDLVTIEEIRDGTNTAAFFADQSSVEPFTSIDAQIKAMDTVGAAIEDCATPAEMGRWETAWTAVDDDAGVNTIQSTISLSDVMRTALALINGNG